MAQNRNNQAQQESAAHRTKRNRVVVVVSAVVVVALALVGVVVWQSGTGGPATNPTGNLSTGSADSASPTSGTTSSSGTTSTSGNSTSGVYIPPDGTTEMGYIEVKSANVKPDALIVNEHLDYQCPYCHLADTLYGSAFRALAERGDIILRIHIRSFVDKNMNNDSSTRAAMAATCADTVGDFIAYHETIFANQPEQEGTGYTDQQLRVDFPAIAGITGADLTTFQTCYDTQKTLAYVQAMEEVNSTSRTINGADQDPPGGTPAIFINGTPLFLNTLIKAESDNTFTPLVATDPDGFLAYLKTIPA